MNNIKMVKLISGEEILGNIVPDGSGGVNVQKPMVLGMMPSPNPGGQPQLGLGEYLPLSDETGVRFKNEHVLFIYTPKQQIVNAYRASTSNLALPQSSGLIKP